MMNYVRTIKESILQWKQHPYLYEDYLKQKFSEYKHICIFGLGNIGLPTLYILKEKGIKIDFLCDNNMTKWGKEYGGIVCLSPDELKKYKEDTLVIICGRAYKEIYRQLSEEEFPHLYRIFTNKFSIYSYFLQNDVNDILNKIDEVLGFCSDEESKRVFAKIIEEWFKKDYIYGELDSIYTDNQYFCDDLFKISTDEVFVDGGAYVGDTLKEFLNVVGNNFEKYYCFELAESNFNRLEKNILKLGKDVRDKVVAINKGLSNCEAEILYYDSDEGSQIDELGNETGYITTIDKEIQGKVSYIKMDIEGSELKALEGAKESIRKYHPKLAICLYHKPQDMWEIPLYIKRLVPEYKIYIRHHTDLLNETVCYALV